MVKKSWSIPQERRRSCPPRDAAGQDSCSAAEPAPSNLWNLPPALSETALQMLENHSFGAIEPLALGYLRKLFTVETVKKGTVVVRHGSVSVDLIAIRTGLLQVESEDRNGEMVPVSLLGPGQVASIALNFGDPVVYQLQAASACEVIRMPWAVIEDAARRWPKFSAAVLFNLMRQMTNTRVTLVRTQNLPMEAQVARLLWGLTQDPRVNSAPLQRAIPYHVSQQTLALCLKTPREEVNRKLKSLEKEGHICKVAKGYVLNPSLPSVFLRHGAPLPVTNRIISELLELVVAPSSELRTMLLERRKTQDRRSRLRVRTTDRQRRASDQGLA